MSWLIVLLVGYFLGSIPFGYFVSKAQGIDIRKYGSGNIGFTNVLRVLGVMPAIIVLFFDSLKGFLSVWLGYKIGGEVLAIIGAFASLGGHIFPFMLKFKGGKGVATGFGIMIFLAPILTLVAAAIFLATVIKTRFVSLGSILAAITIFLGMIILQKPLPYIFFSTLGSLLVIYRHKDNLKRIWQGTENRIAVKNTPKGGMKNWKK